MLFDWHGTLVDTHDAMFSAMEEMLPQLEELGLVEHLLPEEACNNADDARLVRYIRIFRRLHPRILAERRVSRTDIFNAIFGDNREAKSIAHHAYNQCYRKYFGRVKPFQEGVYDYLRACRDLGIKLVVATNRNREFLDTELKTLEDGRWRELFDATVCADDVTHYKPDPEVLVSGAEKVGLKPGADIWYVGDGYTDMVTANNAGVTPIFYNGAHWEPQRIQGWFRKQDRPALIIESFEQLMDELAAFPEGTFQRPVDEVRPQAFPAPAPPEPRQEADWHPALAKLIRPEVILFDWHATLVDTLDAMYHAVDDMLPEFRELGLMERMLEPEDSKTPEDAKLVDYVRQFSQLHPKVRADRKISRTDIFEVLFGDDQDAKAIAHQAFNRHYRNHYGNVSAFEPRVSQMLDGLRRLGIQVGVITNRDREFFEHELAAVEGTGWQHLFDTEVCGDDTPLRKPHPDQLIFAAENLNYPVGPSVWYVGDSTTDIIAAKRAGMTGVFFNGALWDLPWLQNIFPGTHRHPHKPDVVVNDFSEFWALVLACEVGPP
ncbi:HAD family hydrolase [Marinobacter nanhaiticus D15-8W]|uniref:phosphoglycolate phosphatase n=1 Tax=Marinobacter nanhaiticus D15-8W TaxID=626887 RepID=N6W7P2_9GAMM|nr:HAD family hydrolase [Marinobacter nanhaiticus D15-8W]